MNNIAFDAIQQVNTPRRNVLVGGAKAALATTLPGWMGSANAQSASAPRLRPTPSQTEGPYYPVQLPPDTDFDLLKNGVLPYDQGTAAWLVGTVVDTQGAPVQAAVVEIWQCDQAGHYHHPADAGKADPAFQGFGRVTVGAWGDYKFRTLRPAPYSGRTPHIHVKVRLGRRTLLTTQVYVQGDPGNASDSLWRRLSEPARQALTVAFETAKGDTTARFPIVVQT